MRVRKRNNGHCRLTPVFAYHWSVRAFITIASLSHIVFVTDIWLFSCSQYTAYICSEISSYIKITLLCNMCQPCTCFFLFTCHFKCIFSLLFKNRAWQTISCFTVTVLQRSHLCFFTRYTPCFHLLQFLVLVLESCMSAVVLSTTCGGRFQILVYTVTQVQSR